MVNDYTYPQDGDDNNAEAFAQMLGHEILVDYVRRGLDFTPDYATPELSVSDGLAVVSKSQGTLATTGETVYDVGYDVQLSAQTVSLATDAVNYIYVDPQLNTDDSGQIVAETDTAQAPANGLRIGTVDTANDTSNETNRLISARSLELVSGIQFDDSTSSITYDDASDSVRVDAGSELDVTSGTVSLDDDLVATDGETLWDESAGYIPQSQLQHASVTVAGNSVALGGATAIDHADLTSIGASDHHVRPTAGSGIADNADTFDVTTGAGVRIDGNGNVAVDESTVDHDGLANISASDHHVRPTAREGLADNANNFDVTTGSGVRIDANGNVATDHNNPLTVNAGSLDLALGNALTVNAGDLAVNEGAISHDNIGGVSASDHHVRPSAGTALADNSNAFDVQYANGLGMDGNDNLAVTTGAGVRIDGGADVAVDHNAPLTINTGSLDLALGNALTVNSGTLAVNEGAISHDNIVGVSASDHHVRPTAREGLADSSNNFDVTTGVGVRIDGNNDVAVDYNNPLASNSGSLDLALGNALTVNAGDLAVAEGQVSHDNISGVSASDHHVRPSAGSGLTDSSNTFVVDHVTPFTFTNGSLDLSIANALTIDGNGNLAVVEGGINHDNLGGIGANDHHVRPSAGSGLADNSNTFAVTTGVGVRIDGSNDVAVDYNAPLTINTGSLDLSIGNALTVNSGTLVVSEGDISHDNIAGVTASDHHVRPSAGSGLADSSNTFSVTTGVGVRLDGSNDVAVDYNAPLTSNSGSLDVALGNALTVNSGTLAVNEGGISHDNISGVSASDHHVRPSAGSGLSDSSNTFAVDHNAPLTIDTGSLDLALGNALTVSSGSLAVDESGVSHDNIAGVSASDHHVRPIAGSGLADNSNTFDVTTGGGVRIDANANVRLDLNNPFTIDTGSLDVALASTLVVDGNNDLAVDQSNINHANIAGVTADAHHVAHEHPGDRAAQSAVDANGNRVIGASDLSLKDQDGDGKTWRIKEGNQSGNLKFAYRSDDSFSSGEQVNVTGSGNMKLNGELTENAAL